MVLDAMKNNLLSEHLVYNGDAAGCLAENIPQRYFRIHLSGSAEDGYAVRPLSHSEKQI